MAKRAAAQVPSIAGQDGDNPTNPSGQEDRGGTEPPRKRAKGGPAAARFDVNDQPLWEALTAAAAEFGEDGAVLALDGVGDLIVVFARSDLPLYARVPEIVAGTCNLLWPRSRNRPLMRSIAHDRAGLFFYHALVQAPLGATLSCWNSLQPARRVDAIIVVPPQKVGVFSQDNNSHVFAGVIVPVITPINPCEGHDTAKPPTCAERRPEERLVGTVNYRFGSDRTLFDEAVGDTETADGAPPKTALLKGAPSEMLLSKAGSQNLGPSNTFNNGWAQLSGRAATKAPPEGFYAVHYVNLSLTRIDELVRGSTTVGGAAGRGYTANFTLAPPYQFDLDTAFANPCDGGPCARVHRLPGERSRDALLALRDLAAFRPTTPLTVLDRAMALTEADRRALRTALLRRPGASFALLLATPRARW